ncbi:hypothetical protein OG895_43775 [Streptomyces sp. NBC_00201]|uniref:hypothetical protein n=1 Tax=unclassified Streptomyces TaxID=2593676 RepID=UPI00225652E6|nr:MULTISPECIES: hypothetical protein [unclassified Streptomyces]MCX5064187.1 hypothetical protein [Streptomyces sp. NBC_00452]MCX5251969.1 hypothetical protein [Streptomyces sp. NBC_00201]
MGDKDERKHGTDDDHWAKALDRALNWRSRTPFIVDATPTDDHSFPSVDIEWWLAHEAERRRKRERQWKLPRPSSENVEIVFSRSQAERDREREQLRSLLDKHEDWIVEEIDRRKKERERKAHKEAQQTSHVEPPQWEPSPRFAPPTGWREPTNPPWYRAALDDLQQRLDRANPPLSTAQEEGGTSACLFDGLVS